MLLDPLLLTAWGVSFDGGVTCSGYSKTTHEALKAEIKRYQDAVELLSSHRDAHPPLEPSLSNNPTPLA